MLQNIIETVLETSSLLFAIGEDDLFNLCVLGCEFNSEGGGGSGDDNREIASDMDCRA